MLLLTKTVLSVMIGFLLATFLGLVLIPILKKLNLNHTFIRTSGWFEDWWMIDLQYGNHLLIRDEKILIELTEKFKDKSVIEIYQNWEQVVLDYIAK